MASPWGSVLFKDRRGLKYSAHARGGLARYFIFILLPIVFLPLFVFAILAFRQARTDLTRLINNQLSVIADLKEKQIGQWMTDRAQDVNNLAMEPDVRQTVAALLGMENADQQETEGELLEHLNTFMTKNQAFQAFLIARADTGEIILATDRYAQLMGQSLSSSSYFVVSRRGPIVAPPHLDPILAKTAITTLAAAPVIDPQQGTVAVLIGIMYADQLSSLVSPAGPLLGLTGRAYALTGDGYELGVNITPDTAKLSSFGIQQSVLNKVNGGGEYRDAAGYPVYGVYRWLTQYQLAILVEQSTTEAYAPITSFANTIVVITVLTTLISILAILVFTQQLTRPITALTQSAEAMAAGHFGVKTHIDRADEIGLLAEAFNSMSGQLQDLYGTLEQKVVDRTRQLATASEVARIVTATLSIDDLLTRTVELLQERFGYYHVSIFLVDETGRQAVLREGTGEVGARLKAAGYQLEVGSNSLVGWVTAHKKPRVALDVGADAVYLKNELLPDTRSEVVIPLRLGERVIGALDVQSQAPGAFAETDIEALQTLADQIAVGIENGRLFARQSQVIRLEQILSTLTSKIHQARQLDSMLENTATELGRALGARRVVVRLTPAGSAPAAPATATPSPAPPEPEPDPPPTRRRGDVTHLLDRL